jgi:hypothetical protein
MFLDLLFVWYWESYCEKCESIISLKDKKVNKVLNTNLNRIKIYFKYSRIIGFNNKMIWIDNNFKISKRNWIGSL